MDPTRKHKRAESIRHGKESRSHTTSHARSFPLSLSFTLASVCVSLPYLPAFSTLPSPSINLSLSPLLCALPCNPVSPFCVPSTSVFVPFNGSTSWPFTFSLYRPCLYHWPPPEPALFCACVIFLPSPGSLAPLALPGRRDPYSGFLVEESSIGYCLSVKLVIPHRRRPSMLMFVRRIQGVLVKTICNMQQYPYPY